MQFGIQLLQIRVVQLEIEVQGFVNPPEV